ncbi:MAG: hypothetical protein V4481_04920 [Patescibacteria group bacterium]
MQLITRKRYGILIWFSLVVSLVALSIAILAYTRVELNISTDLERKHDETAAQLSIKSARLQALAHLSLLEVREHTTENFDEFGQQVAYVEQNLENAYRNARIETLPEWQSFKRQFTNLRQEVQNKSPTSLESLRTLVERLGDA